jgi:fructosamine-3-kinase
MTGGSVQNAVLYLVPQLASVRQVSAVSGGSTSDASRVTVTDGDGRSRTLFVKSNAISFLDHFEAEIAGLRRLADCGVIGVPQPIATGVFQNRAYLITQWIEPTVAGDNFFRNFGIALADLHRVTSGDQIGLDHDNYLGASRQPNATRQSWPEFFAVQRIEYQLRWAIDQRVTSASLRRDCEGIIRNIDTLLSGREQPTSLLHGDLWSGNYLCGPNAQPVVIDPAVYYGCREAEFGMLRLFGGCPTAFYQAYQQRFPLPEGWQRRAQVYTLYHLLNHLNLFGSGYRVSCENTAAEILCARS